MTLKRTVLLLALSFSLVFFYKSNVDAYEPVLYQVALDGTKDFCLIQDAIDAAKDGDIILIWPGVYNECINVYGKNISIMGANKDTCIIRSSAKNYLAAPMTIGKGTISNLTIYGYLPDKKSSNEFILSVQSVCDINTTQLEKDTLRQTILGYTVHADQDDMQDSTLVFTNCRIISEANHCIGVGSKSGHTVVLDSCELISSGIGGCIYYHNDINPGKDSNLIIRNTMLNNYKAPYVISLHSISGKHNTNLTFQNVNVKTVAYNNAQAYNLTNIYTGFSVDEWNENGYDFIDKKTLSQSINFAIDLRDTKDISNANIKLKNGVTYLVSSQDNVFLGGKRTVFDLYNFDNEVSDGWCGLNGFMLTPASYGNIFPEMNYY